MSAAKEFKLEFKPTKASPADKINFFMGTNATGKHLEEAMRQGIIDPGERLLGFFDGIFFDSNGKRIGGLALHDYLIVSDRRITLWARDQFKDFVDHFDLAQSLVVESHQKDALHGTIQFNFSLATSEEEKATELEPLELTFDFVPLADLKQIAEIVEVAGNVHRDLEAGGVGEKDRWQATWVLFNKVFVNNQRPNLRGGISQFPRAAETYKPEPTRPAAREDALDDLMTPLSRLDNLDGSSPRRVSPQPAPAFAPRHKPTGYSSGFSENQETEQDNDEIEADLQWFGGTGPGPGARGYRTGAGQPGPGTRLKQDMTPEGLYSIGRAGRAAWDGIDKVRREAESRFEAKGSNVLPMLNTLRESGMNLKDISEFVTAINGLLETLNNSPAAYELAMNFINRSSMMSNFGGGATKKSRSIPEVEDITDESPAGGKSAERKNERSTASVIDPFKTPRKKVTFRKHNEEETPEELTQLEPEVLEVPENLPVNSADRLAESVELPRPESNGSPVFKKRPITIGVRTVQVHSSASEISNN